MVDDSGVVASLDKTAALTHSRTHLALRGAVDYQLVEGYLWLTTGYAYNSPTSPQNWRQPAFARLGGHTLALGIESTYEEFTLSVGYAHTLERRRVTQEESASQVINPFDGATAAGNAGTYTASSDQLGFALEMSWE